MKLATASITSLILLLVSHGSVVLALPDEEGSPSTLRSHLRKTLDIKTSSSNNRRRFLMIPGFLAFRAANRGKGSIRTNRQISKIDASKIAHARAGAGFGVSRRNNKYAPPRNSMANHASSVPKIRGTAVDDDEPLDDSAVPSDKPTFDSATSIAIAIAAYHRVHLHLIEDERPRRLRTWA